MKVAVLPAFNEEIAIGSVVLKARKHVDRVIVIDDGSTDATAYIADLAGAEIIKHEKNLGKGAAIETGFKRARELNASLLVLLDADGQHDADEIPALIEPIIKNEADIVVGSRFIRRHKNIPRYRILGQKILTFITNIISGRNITDSQSGFRAFNKKAIEAMRFEERGIGIESYIQIKAGELDLRITEVPISCIYGKDTSTYNPLHHGLSVITSIVRYISQQRPLTFFGIPGVLSLLTGIYIGASVIYKFNMTRAVPIGSALLTAIFILAGLFSLFTGIILYSIGSYIARIERKE